MRPLPPVLPRGGSRPQAVHFKSLSESKFRVLPFGNENEKTFFALHFAHLFVNLRQKSRTSCSNASEQVRILHFGIKKKHVSFVLHSIFRKFAPNEEKYSIHADRAAADFVGRGTRRPPAAPPATAHAETLRQAVPAGTESRAQRPHPHPAAASLP